MVHDFGFVALPASFSIASSTESPVEGLRSGQQGDNRTWRLKGQQELFALDSWAVSRPGQTIRS
jgi:hypothetical protein